MSVLGKIIFWFHVVIVLFGISMGFYLPLYIVLLVVVLHRLHLVVFKDCLLSKVEKKLQSYAKEMSFIQYAAMKLFKRKISEFQSRILNYCFSIFPITIALIK